MGCRDKRSGKNPKIVERAIRIAQTGRPGPVVISLPEDILQEEAEMQFGSPLTIPRPVPSKNELLKCQEILAVAKKPVILAGGGVKHAQAEDELRSFAEKFEIPVLAAFRRHDVFPNNHPLYVGHLDGCYPCVRYKTIGSNNPGLLTHYTG